MNWAPVGLIVIGLVWFGALVWTHLRAVGKAKAAETWPTASGKVTGCEVVVEESSDREGGTTTWYNPVVSYAYDVGGRELTGQRLRFGNYRSSSRKKADAMIAPYAVGSSPTVRYNPEKPEECVLETKKPGPVYLVMAVFGLLFVAMGVFWVAKS
ncbi:MAG: DUF3592 domain-containing protein [Allosphingosinicella sp.]